MKCLTSYQEIDALGEGLFRNYTKKKHRWNAMCFDIEGFITDYLKLPIMYEIFAEADKSKLGFLSNGIEPLRVERDGRLCDIVYKKDTIVIERFLLRNEESGRRRFTLAHEAAHYIMKLHLQNDNAAVYHNDYDEEGSYSVEDITRMFSLNESFANRLGAALLMPEYLVRKALGKYNEGNKIVLYDGGVFSKEEKIKLQKMADGLGVSFTAMLNRLKSMLLLELRPIEEYIEKGLGLGGVS